MQYYVLHESGQRFGPADLPLLQSWVNEGRILPVTQLENAATGETLSASSLPGLSFLAKPPMGNPYSSDTSSAYPGYAAPVNVPWVKSILSLACCCMPLGIVAVIFASQANTYASSGNIQMAREHAAKADAWANWGIIIGVVGTCLYFAFGVAAGGLG